MGLGKQPLRVDGVRWGAIVFFLLAGVVLGTLLHDSLLSVLRSSGGEREGDETAAKTDKRLVAVDPGIAAALGIEIATAAPADLATEFQVVGTVGFNDTKMARLAVRVTGTVREVRKSIGDTATPGEVLAVLDSRDIADAKSAYLAAKDKLALTERTLRRQEELLSGKATSEKDVLSARREFNQARIDLRNATQNLFTLGLHEADLDKLEIDHGDLSRYDVVAPFAGEVLEKHIFVGELLPQDREVFVMADLDVVWANLRIGPESVKDVYIGTPARITSSTGLNAAAKVTYVAPVISGETRSVWARVDLPNPDHRWRPGMTVDAIIEGPSARAAVVVPNEAVQIIAGKPSVFLPVEGGFRMQPVKLGRSNAKVTEILKGLAVGDKVASGETFALKSELEKGADDD